VVVGSTTVVEVSSKLTLHAALFPQSLSMILKCPRSQGTTAVTQVQVPAGHHATSGHAMMISARLSSTRH
jgi:hypothetical protein